VRDLVPQKPDAVIFTGSPNDHCESCTVTDQQIANEMGTAIKSLQQANPDILIIVCSPFQGSPTQAKAMQDVAIAAGVPFIDFVNLPLFDKTNNGQRQLSTGHPTRLGSSYIAAQLLKEIAALKN
jgi:lysophospholipase L1-like esterase